MADYAKALNEAQYRAVTAPKGNVLVVAGAGTGKTRTIVYRLAWLIEQGVSPESILLLTFTRKAAQEMLNRAGALLGYSLAGLAGGTFHSFAFGALRSHPPAWLQGRNFTLMDASDINQAIRQCREDLKAGKKDASFPKTQTIAGLISKSRNKEIPIAELLRQESYHLLPHAQAIEDISSAYAAFKRESGLMDYDDLLFELEALFNQNRFAAFELRARFSNILVDEYQDTNLVQARIVRQLAVPSQAGADGASVMAVGDEAQSIYAFRGATVRNILDFQKLFPATTVIPLEHNYRSTQPILEVANGILAQAQDSFRKHLFTDREGGDVPRLVRPFSDNSEAELVCSRIKELLGSRRPSEIAVLFRAGFHSYGLENSLRKAGIPFKKYGGIRFTEAAHIKDILAFGRFAINSLDLPAFGRLAAMHKGIGPKTMANLQAALASNDHPTIQKAFKRFPGFREDLLLVERLRGQTPSIFFEKVLEHYRPRLEELYSDDWPTRLQGLEEILNMSHAYENMDLFIADLALESPDSEMEDSGEDCITLSTVHSAKGLEWDTVIILDAVEDRFPSRHSLSRPEDFEEERRLFYVACTRAKNHLEIYAPAAVYGHGGGSMTSQSPFLAQLPSGLFTTHMESYGGAINSSVAHDRKAEKEEKPKGRSGLLASRDNKAEPACRELMDYCFHRIFGRGKIIARLDDNRIRVNFPGFGEKTILADYLMPEE